MSDGTRWPEIDPEEFEAPIASPVPPEFARVDLPEGWIDPDGVLPEGVRASQILAPASGSGSSSPDPLDDIEELGLLFDEDAGQADEPAAEDEPAAGFVDAEDTIEPDAPTGADLEEWDFGADTGLGEPEPDASDELEDDLDDDLGL